MSPSTALPRPVRLALALAAVALVELTVPTGCTDRAREGDGAVPTRPASTAAAGERSPARDPAGAPSAASGAGAPAAEAAAGGPSPAARPDPPTARRDLADALRAARAETRHPADGGGRAWLAQADGDPAVARASTPGRFTIVYEVGPLGIATGGAIHFQVSPFWGWSTPQVDAPAAPGYTTITPSAADAALEAQTLDRQLLGLRVTGRALAPGEQVRIVYGAGPAGAVADRFAERRSRFWIAVDGDGDGVRAFLADSPGIDVAPSAPARLVVTLPTTARPGDAVRVTIAVLDAAGNAGLPVTGALTFPDPPPGLALAEPVVITEHDAGRVTVEARARAAGVVRLRVEGPGGLSAESNPLLVAPEGPRILWGDLHGHSGLSDGTGVPDDYLAYARDVAALDVIALTDHDHWGVLPLDEHPALWAEITQAVARFHAPGRFVTLLGYEWTSWIYGHRHVLYFTDGGDVLSSVDPGFESPLALWRALAGRAALTFAHHSAGGPIATDWTIPPDPVLEPVTEVVSVHGASEAADAPRAIYDPVAGNYVRDALARGYRLGFVGSGDSHDGHPGLAHLAAPSGGLAAILAEDCTRAAVLGALRARRVYATNGPRILLRTALGTHPMGTTVALGDAATLSEALYVRIVAPAPIARVDVVRSGAVVAALAPEADARDLALEHPLTGLRAGEYVYVRVVQTDGGAAWSSPIYLE